MSSKNILVEQMAILFGEPRTADPHSFLATYVNTLRGYDDDVLKVAAKNIAKSRKITAWPTIGECLDAIETAKHQLKNAAVGLQKIDNWDQWYGGLLAQIKGAASEREIDDAIGKISAYARARWCFPYRLTDAEALGAKRRAELRGRGNVGRAAAAGPD